MALHPGPADLVERLAEADAVDLAVGGEPRRPARQMSKRRPLESVGWVNRNALRSGSGMPPRYCQRTSGCISVSLLIGSSTTTSRSGARQRQHVLVQVGIAARIPRRPVAVAFERACSARDSVIGAPQSILEQRLDRGRRRECRASPLTKPVICRPSGRPFVRQHRQRDRGHAEQRGVHRAVWDRRSMRAPSARRPAPTGLTQASHSAASSA